MKNKMVKKILCLSAAAMLGISTPAAVMAAEVSQEGAAVTETEAAAETGTEIAEEERIPEDVTLSLQTGDVVLKNETKRFFASAEYKRAESRVLETEESVNTEETEVVAQTWDFVLTEEAPQESEEGTVGEVHTFEDVRADKWKEPVLTEEFGFLYITYLDEEEEKQECCEKAEEKELEAPVTVYATTEVNIRETADTTSASLKVAALGDELKAIASVPGWVKVEIAGVTGYIHHEYVTEDKSEIDALTVEKQAAQTTPQEEKTTNTDNSQSSNYQEPDYGYDEPSQPSNSGSSSNNNSSSNSGSSSNDNTSSEESGGDDSGEVTEIGREAFDDCDGSGHGYYEITYSDGSVSYEEY